MQRPIRMADLLSQPSSLEFTLLPSKAKGFKTYQQTGLILHGNEKVGLGNLMLELGQASRQIEVSAEVTKLQTESAERSATAA